MLFCTGCVIMRDKNGNPGERIMIREDISKEQADAICKNFISAEEKLRAARKKEKMRAFSSDGQSPRLITG